MRVFLFAVKNKSEPMTCQVFDYKEMGMKTERTKGEKQAIVRKKCRRQNGKNDKGAATK